MTTSARLLVGGAVIVVLALLAGMLLVLSPWGGGKSHLTVDFDRTVSLYEGADVRILGVPVGQVDSVDPMGDKVRVELSWDSEYKVPANAKAVIVSPAIVGDRYVQLTPAYDGGPELEDDANLDASDTAVPVELDRVYESLDQLATALGPQGANKDGSLDRLLNSSAKAFDGQGEKFHRTLEDLSKLTGTLDDNKDELFGSVGQLERFVKALADNDVAVREFNSSLSEVSRMLKGERGDLAGALRALGGSLEEVRSYVQENRSALKGNVDALVDVTDQLVDQRDNLAKIMDTAPTALSNQVLAYDPSIGALDGRSTVGTRESYAYSSWEDLLGVTERKPLTYAGVQRAFCAFLSKRGAIGGQNDPDISACIATLNPFAADVLISQGLPTTASATEPDETGRPPDESDGLARLLAVNP